MAQVEISLGSAVTVGFPEKPWIVPRLSYVVQPFLGGPGERDTRNLRATLSALV